MKDEKVIKARYRNKLDKIIIEVWNGEKWLYVKTLRSPLLEFSDECLEKVSLNDTKNIQKEPQKFSQYLLTEPLKQDTNLNLTPEEADKLARQAEIERLLEDD